MNARLILLITIVFAIVVVGYSFYLDYEKIPYREKHKEICSQDEAFIRKVLLGFKSVEVINGCVGKESNPGAVTIYMDEGTRLKIDYEESQQREWIYGIPNYYMRFYKRYFKKHNQESKSYGVSSDDFSSSMKVKVENKSIYIAIPKVEPLFDQLKFENNMDSKKAISFDLVMLEEPLANGYYAVIVQRHFKFTKGNQVILDETVMAQILNIHVLKKPFWKIF